MRLPVIAAACSLGLMFSLPAAAGQTQKAKNTQQANNQKIVCKYIYHQGAIIGRKPRCATKQEWRNVRISMQSSLREFQQRSLTGRPR